MALGRHRLLLVQYWGEGKETEGCPGPRSRVHPSSLVLGEGDGVSCRGMGDGFGGMDSRLLGNDDWGEGMGKEGPWVGRGELGVMSTLCVVSQNSYGERVVWVHDTYK